MDLRAYFTTADDDILLSIPRQEWRPVMKFFRKIAFISALYCTLAVSIAWLQAADVSGWTAQQKEEFLKTAKVVQTHSAAKGVTGTLRVTLSDGVTTHDASVQTIDERKTMFQPDNGPVEMNFVDSYKYNIAAWKLAVLLGIADMMPPSVERSFREKGAAFTWWIDDVMMDEGDRQKKKLAPPNQDNWNKEMNTMVVFDQLVFNTDRNVGNMVIDKGWHLWMIDHTRAFRAVKTPKAPRVLTFCDRNLFEKMKALDEPTLKKELGQYVGGFELQGLLARRDAIVKIFEAKGSSALYDRPSHSN